MPNRIKRECRKLGCLSLTDNANGYCDKHQQEKFMRYDRYRKSAAQRGYNARWQRYRKIFLQEHPICANCRNAPASVVDHIKPHKGDYDLFWDEDNHQALCKRCHDIKTATEDGGFGNDILKK